MKLSRLRSMMGKATAPFLTAMVLAGATACTPAENVDDSRLNVVTTIPPVADLVRQVGGELVDVTVMVPAGASPHTYEPTPGQMVEVSHADVYVKVGSGVEFEIVWLDKLLAQNQDIALVDASDGILLVDSDPHIWNSPLKATQMVDNIAEGLAEVDPSHIAAYSNNAGDYISELEQLDRVIRELYEPFSNRYFMIYHPSFAYFAAEYDLVQLAIEHNGKPPTPQVLQASVDAAREHNLQYVFAAPQLATADAQSVAEAIGGEVTFLDPLADQYLPNMSLVAKTIARELE